MANLGRLLLTVAVFAAVWGVYSIFGGGSHGHGHSLVSPHSSGPESGIGAEDPTSPFHCDGRTYCSQMKSCAEAKYFLDHCPNVKMDGDHDGVPCESQWCPNG